MNRLETIANRQRKFVMRDVLFAVFVVFAGAVGIATVSGLTSTTQIAQR